MGEAAVRWVFVSAATAGLVWGFYAVHTAAVALLDMQAALHALRVGAEAVRAVSR